MGRQDNLRCPCCLKPLEVTHRERYQSLQEHVSSPNSTPSLKDGYQCLNNYCVANNLDAAWLEDGDFFFRDLPEKVKYVVAREAVQRASKENQVIAVGSWNYYYEKGQKAIKKRTVFLNFYLFKIEIRPQEKGCSYPLEKQYNPSWRRWKLAFWKKSEHGYLHVIPFWKMVSHCVKKFNYHYQDWIEDRHKGSLEECHRIATREEIYGPGRDKRFYAIVTMFWLRLFYPVKTKKVILDYKHRALYHLVTNRLGVQEIMLLDAAYL